MNRNQNTNPSSHIRRRAESSAQVMRELIHHARQLSEAESLPVGTVLACLVRLYSDV